MDGLPDELQIGLEISMDHSVAHALHLVPRDLGLRLCKCSVVVENLSRSFADYQYVSDDRVLCSSVPKECILCRALHVFLDSLARTKNVFDIVSQP